MNENPVPEALKTESPKYDQTQVQFAVDQLRNEQNLAAGAICGIFGALLGAGIWAVVTIFTHFQIGWMAVGIGFLVGIVVRTFGKGIDKVFGVIGAVLALLGCGLGNLFAACGMIAVEEKVGFLKVLSSLNPALVKALMIATFSPMDLFFYGIAVYEGYKLSFRNITPKDIEAKIIGQTITDIR
jgi:hypothetical protein